MLPSVAIVGAGPVGLALALRLLADRRVAALSLIDASSAAQARADARVLALSAGSLRLLVGLGLGAELAAQAAPIRRIRVLQRGAGARPPLGLPAPSVSIDAAEHGRDRLGCTLRYGALVETLATALAGRGAAASSPRLDWRRATRVQGVDEYADRVELRLAPSADDGTAAPPMTLAADLAVIAEGGRFDEQPVRALHRDYHQTALLGSVRLSWPQPGLAVECFTDEGPLALLPSDDANSFALVWCVRSQNADALRALPQAEAGALIEQRLGLPELGRLTLLGPLAAAPLGLNARRELVEGRRRVYVGNAAQTLHPVAGQGFNLGLRDAWCLADLLRDHAGDVHATLSAYPAARRADRRALLAVTDALARGFTLPGLAPLRGLGLAGLALAAPLRQRFAELLMFGAR